MSGLILIADDDESFLSFVKEFAEKLGIVNAVFRQTLNEVIAALRDDHFIRIILDNIFDNDDMTGIDVLEQCNQQYPDVDRFLVTGRPLDQIQRARLSNIGGRIINKGVLTAEDLRLLLTCAPGVGQIPSDPIRDVDKGVLSVRLNAQIRRNSELKGLVDLLASDIKSDILRELNKLYKRHKNDNILYIGGVDYNAKMLIDALNANDEPGPLLIELHHKLFRKG
ncbi:MAG: hypothetical protein GYA46_02345 [candidate division Zixibacteria bacterium]|nr:hypothetical protein [candidate division Zixibacteria bacterium]